jgi:hypothetical protein
MNFHIAFACLLVLFPQGLGYRFFPLQSREKVATFTFADAKYFHRFTNEDQHEYTPAGQENLNTWTEMVTVHVYRTVKDGEGLASTANAVLENYKANKGVIIKTDSVPRTKDRPAEHLIVAVFGRPDFIEAAFARFKMNEGIGGAVIFSHRIYGKRVGDQMSAWLAKNGAAVENSLMKWDALPKAPASR